MKALKTSYLIFCACCNQALQGTEQIKCSIHCLYTTSPQACFSCSLTQMSTNIITHGVKLKYSISNTALHLLLDYKSASVNEMKCIKVTLQMQASLRQASIHIKSNMRLFCVLLCTDCPAEELLADDRCYYEAGLKIQLVSCTLCLKKRPTFKLSVTLSNLNRFSKFLHYCKAYKIRYKTDTKLPTSPQACCYTALRN